MSFRDIKGHDNIKLFFNRVLSSNRLASSYLFFGPEGVGKTLMATTLAKALNCLEQTADSCDKCSSCIKIENRNHPDISLLEVGEKKDAISIRQVRDLQGQINLTPYEGRTKVFIVQNAHLMSAAAANCFLKTLEEPPKNSVIILITSRWDWILPTVKSRCEQIRFGPLELKFKIELAQKWGFSKEEAVFLSRLENIDISILSDLDKERLFDYKNRVLTEFNSDKTILDENNFIFTESKEKLKFAISILESWFRDIVVLKTGTPSLLAANLDKVNELEGLADRFSFEELESILKDLEETYFYIDRNVGPKLALNDLKIKLGRYPHE